MRTYLKRASKLSYLYLICLLVFFVMSISYVGIFKGNNESNLWISVISCFSWFYGVYAWYLESKKMGQTDKIPYFNLKPSPLRGLLIGVVSMIVISLGAFIISYLLLFFFRIYSFLLVSNTEPFTWNNAITDNIWNVLIKFAFSPFYWITSFAGNKVWQYPIAAMTYPITFMAGYAAGLYRSGMSKKKEMKNSIRLPH